MYESPTGGNRGRSCRTFLCVSAGKGRIQTSRIRTRKKVGERTEDVLHFWKTGVLDPTSNVQFGEGGAGTFSDGKLNTLVKDPVGRNRFVLDTFVSFGAPEKITYENKPHIGTDILSKVIAAMREEIFQLVAHSNLRAV